jgi:hypothetical protein
MLNKIRSLIDVGPLVAKFGSPVEVRSLVARVGSFVVRPLIFLAVFAATTLILALLPTTNAFWRVMDLRFSQDERYQIQSMFLPDHKRVVPLAVIGDSLFQSAVTAQAGQPDGAARIVINGYDADDFRDVFSAIRAGEASTKTRICTLVLQISPNFLVRAKSQHMPQAYHLLPVYAGPGGYTDRVRNFFGAVASWVGTWDGGDIMNAPHLRVSRHVGQTRFADPTEENWKRALARIKNNKIPVLGILDLRETDWGEDGNLVQETERLLTQLSKDSRSFSWMRLEDFRESALPGCNRRAATRR